MEMGEKEKGRVKIEAEPEPIEIDCSKAAVLVVDMQNAFVNKGGYFDLVGYDVSAVQKIIEPCQRIINAARAKGIKIIYFRMGYSPDLSDKGPPESPCVESTLRRSFFLDYFPILISDAVSQKGPRTMQEATIWNVQSTFGWVTDSMRFIKAIE
jgi:nicotinamidase-related amidase